jgi:hypothetical protein
MAFAAERPPEGWPALVRHVAVIGLAGVTTGVLVGGLGSRVFMRIAGATGSEFARGRITEAGFRVGEITLGGTIALVVFVGIFVGIIGAVVYTAFRPWLAWAGRWRGVIFGVGLFAVGSATSDVMNPDNVDFFILGNDVANVATIVALFLLFGVVLEEVHRRLDRRIPDDGSATAVWAIVTGFGLVLGLPLVITTMFTSAGCGCDPPILASSSVVVAGVGTVLWWGSGRRPATRGLAQVLGFAGMLGALGFGLVRAISDAVEILG